MVRGLLEFREGGSVQAGTHRGDTGGLQVPSYRSVQTQGGNGEEAPLPHVSGTGSWTDRERVLCSIQRSKNPHAGQDKWNIQGVSDQGFLHFPQKSAVLT
jgi:hypothetical protein